jgi:hypothetical protein
MWWIRLGINPELIEPGKPQQNGRHERMHKTLKAEATRPPAGNPKAQQRKFNTFRKEDNEVGPHEALNQETPTSMYTKSKGKMPKRLPPVEYSGAKNTKMCYLSVRLLNDLSKLQPVTFYNFPNPFLQICICSPVRLP